MEITATQNVAGRMVEEALGTVQGTGYWASSVANPPALVHDCDEEAPRQSIALGLQQARQQAEAKIKAIASAMGADAVIALRIDVMELGCGIYQATLTGTAVKTAALPGGMPYFGLPANDEAFEAPYMPLPGLPDLRLVSSRMH